MMNDWDIANAKREACEEARAEGKAEGKAESRLEIAKNLLNLGADANMISKATGLTEQEIKAL